MHRRASTPRRPGRRDRHRGCCPPRCPGCSPAGSIEPWRNEITSVTTVNSSAQPISSAPSTRDSTPLRSSSGTAIAEPSRIGTSRRMMRPSIVGGAISAPRPSTSEMFAAHEPMTTPSAIGGLCASAVLVATASSGAEFAYATTTNPTTSGCTPNPRASAAEPRTSHSLPQYKIGRCRPQRAGRRSSQARTPPPTSALRAVNLGVSGIARAGSAHRGRACRAR